MFAEEDEEAGNWAALLAMAAAAAINIFGSVEVGMNANGAEGADETGEGPSGFEEEASACKMAAKSRPPPATAAVDSEADAERRAYCIYGQFGIDE
jgi:hypothetical protein